MEPVNNSQTFVNNRMDLVSDKLITIFNTVNLAIIAASIATFGIMSNVCNIVIFFKQGISDTVNIGLLALAVSDLGCLLTLEGVCVFRNPLIFYQLPIIPDEIQHLVACWPHACFARITSSITVYITFERCLCVLMPLKVKRIITPKVTIWVIVCIFIAMILTLTPEYATNYLGWKFVPEKNRTLIGLLFIGGNHQMPVLTFNFSVGTNMTSFGALIVFTVLLVVKIQEKSKWRQSTSSVTSKDNSFKDRRTVKMIVLVAIIYCICFLPMLGCFIATSIFPEFMSMRIYNNTFFVVWSFACLFHGINGSANIFVYYRMSTKYRTTFHSLWLFKKLAKNAE